MPHVVDLCDTLMLFANVANNPVGLALLGSLVGFFLVVLFWAWKKDKEDLKKVSYMTGLWDMKRWFHVPSLAQGAKVLVI